VLTPTERSVAHAALLARYRLSARQRAELDESARREQIIWAAHDGRWMDAAWMLQEVVVDDLSDEITLVDVAEGCVTFARYVAGRTDLSPERRASALAAWATYQRGS